MNKGTGLLQAELKLVYYWAPFEVSVGGSGRAELRVFPGAFCCHSHSWCGVQRDGQHMLLTIINLKSLAAPLLSQGVIGI